MSATARNYSLLGPESEAARARGLASATWYASPIPRKQMKELMRRKDGPALRDTAIWLVCLFGSGALAASLWGSWWAVPVFAVYGVLYGSSTDSRWHECGHGTAFRTRWMNDVVYHMACFMILREPTIWRWSHTRHHTDTIVVGLDPEIAVPRPTRLRDIAMDFFALRHGPKTIGRLFLHAAGRLADDERTYVPDSETWKVFAVARVWLAIFAGVIALSLATWSLLPLMLVGLPTFYGAWLYIVFGLTQHAGLAEDTLDHRLNARTVYMNPVSRFLYWNMNYHVEHHMFPMVPYHALPALHEAMKPDTPAPYRGLIDAYREIIPTILRQRRDPTYFVRRELPPGAQPFVGAEPMRMAAE